jgi:hypothetical protein
MTEGRSSSWLGRSRAAEAVINSWAATTREARRVHIGVFTNFCR